jgi:enterochelin esterase-like enzyme
MKTCFLSLCLAGVFAQMMPAAAPPAVWVIGEGFRVDPLTGNVREEQRIDGNPIPADFDYTHKNLAWDAGKRQVSLSAARNEVAAYQLQIRGPAQGVAVTCSDLKGPAVIRAGRDIDVFKQWYINVTTNSSNKDSTTAGYNLGKGWYADALIPVSATGGFGQPFDIPDKMNGIAGQEWQGAWVDIYVPRDVPAGEYNGTVTVAGKGTGKSTLPVKLKVYDVTLSDDYAYEVGLNNYGSIGRKGSDVRLRYYQMARRHRMAIHEHYISTKVEGAGGQMRGVWDDYDAEMGKYFTGDAFTEKYGYHGPGEGKPLRWVYLPFEILRRQAWPMPAEAQRTPEYDAAVRAMLRDFTRHFESKGWTRTDLMFFINGLDEPTKPEAVDSIRYFGDLVKPVGAPRVYFRGDINHLHDIGGVIPGWTEQMMLEKLGPVIDLWCMVADFKRTDFSVLLERKKRDPKQVVWFYQNREPSVGGYTLDDETIGLATWPVIVWKYGLDGCILWECSYKGPSKNIWVDPNNSVSGSRGTIHNMAGFVIYPEYPGKEGITEPVPSIRLKSFRRGAQDAEYLRLLEKAAGRDAAMKALNSVMGHCLYEPNRPYGAAGDWSHNPENWNRMRVGVLQEIAAAASGLGQPAQPIQSPEVHSDKGVTFRFRAPNAKQVLLERDGAKRLPMEKDQAGVWSITTEPLEPDFYSYSFVADGVSLMDPSNPLIQPNLLNSGSVVHVPGPASLPWEVNNVPHGTIHRHFYRSGVVGDDRDFYVYTPPGYDPTAKRLYPVLYLLHGYSDDASAWTAVGRAHVILDNLIAEGRAKPMLIVMPLGYGAPEIVSRRGPRLRDPSLRQQNYDKFRDALFTEVIPMVEKTYRVSKDRNSRAIAGLSMGGSESLYTGLNALDRFAWVGAFSSGGLSEDFNTVFPELDSKANSQLRLFWMACGKSDRLIEVNRKFIDWLKSKKIQYTWTETPGTHNWLVWRRYLAEFVPLLYK